MLSAAVDLKSGPIKTSVTVRYLSFPRSDSTIPWTPYWKGEVVSYRVRDYILNCLILSESRSLVVGLDSKLICSNPQLLLLLMLGWKQYVLICLRIRAKNQLNLLLRYYLQSCFFFLTRVQIDDMIGLIASFFLFCLPNCLLYFLFGVFSHRIRLITHFVL